MKQLAFQLTSASPMSHSKVVSSPKNKGEKEDAYDTRCWREHLHTNADGQVIIPSMMLQNCLVGAAQYLGEKIVGRGAATWTKHFRAGLLVSGDMVLRDSHSKPILGHAIEGERLFLNADGKRGGGTRVWRTYPVIMDWTCRAEIALFDPTLTQSPKKVGEYLKHAGMFIGLGRFRPINGGCYGRFTVKEL